MIDELSKLAGNPIKPGRNTIAGYPVDIEDGDPESLWMKGVDSDVTHDLMKLLRSKGFRVQFNKRIGQFAVSHKSR